MSFALTEHTADVGIHIESESLEDLFADAGRGLFAIIAGNLEQIECVRSVEIQLLGENREFLLLDWLQELLVLFELRKMLLNRFQIHIDARGLTATVSGESIDFARHQLLHEVKAITYHRLSIERTAQGWVADVVVDI